MGVIDQSVEWYDKATGVNVKSKTKIAIHGDCVLMFHKTIILNEIKAFMHELDQFKSENEYKESEYSGKLNDAKTNIRMMYELIGKMSDENLETIIDCLPRLKNGNIRNAVMPLYMSGITAYQGERGAWARVTSIELSLTPREIPGFIRQDKVKSCFEIEFTKFTRQYDKTDTPIIDKDWRYNKVTFKRNSYLKQKTLIPGHVYKDAKDKEYLYIGVMSYGMGSKIKDALPLKANEYPIACDALSDADRLMKLDHVYLKLNDKRRKELSAYNCFGDWMSDHIRKYMGKSSDIGSTRYYDPSEFNISVSLKFVEDVGEMFAIDKLKCDIDVSVIKNITPQEIRAKGRTHDYVGHRSRIVIPGTTQ